MVTVTLSAVILPQMYKKVLGAERKSPGKQGWSERLQVFEL